MASSMVINILGNASNFINATGQAQSSLDKWGARAGKVGAGMALALAGAATAAVKAAADQSAAVSAWTQVTGQQMDKQQQTIARSLNLSQTDYAKSFTTLSSLYQSNGLSQKKANEMAAKGLKTAADQAAFGNTTVAEAVEAQAGLLKGSGELLEKYAISITAADVAARMKAEGLDKLKGAELKAATAMTKANLVQEQSAKFAGQAAREAGSLESRQQKLTATIEDFKAKLGANLLPIVEQFIGKLQSVAEWVQNNETKTKILVGVLAGFAVALLAVSAAIKVVRAAQVAWNAIMVATNVIMFANPVVLVTVAIVALAAAVVVAYKKSETFRNVVDKAMKMMRNVVISVIQFVVDKFLWYAETILGAAAKAFGWVPGLGGKLKKAHEAIKKFRDDTNATLEGLKDQTVNVHIKAVTDPKLKYYQGQGFNVRGSEKLDGARAAGGPFMAGKSYLVGENGPEIATFGGNGFITPNHRLRGGGGGGNGTVTVVLDVRGGDHELRQLLRKWAIAGGGKVA